MALNWDKFSKLRNDLPRPKFALAECIKRLKKQPNEPYLLAWRMELASKFSDHGAASEPFRLLQNHKPPITDTDLLNYIYQYGLEVKSTSQEASTLLPLNSIGSDEREKIWGSAAKALTSRKARLRLWSNLFICAMKADCWDDARYALFQANRESVDNKKNVSFSLALANHLSAEKARENLDKDSSPDSKVKQNEANTQSTIAYLTLKNAVKNASNKSKDVIKVESMRDFRLVVQIYRRQGRGIELLDHLATEEVHLRQILDKHGLETAGLRMELMQENQLYPKLWDLIREQLLPTVNGQRLDISSAKVSWDIWNYAIQAAIWCSHIEAPERYSSIHDEAYSLFREGLRSDSLTREQMLAGLTYTAYCDKRSDLLYDWCLKYFNRFGTAQCCFDDLRSFVERLSLEHRRMFHDTIKRKTENSKPLADASNADLIRWFLAEINVAKFEYLLLISMPQDPQTDLITRFVCNTIRLCIVGRQLGTESYVEAGVLAGTGLLVLSFVTNPKVGEEEQPLGKNGQYFSMPYMLQAAFLFQYLLTTEFGKQNRPLVLLSTALHLRLGFASLAFEQYRHARVKEFLKDTVSYILLTEISQIHPFDSTRPYKLSPDEELEDIVRTMRRMERTVDDTVFVGIQDFQYDQALELLDLKRALKGSLTKRLCLVERRRIARLQGKPIDPILYDTGLNEHQSIVQNQDYNILPNYESSQQAPIDRLFRHKRGYPTHAWYCKYMEKHERACALLYGEDGPTTFPAREESSKACRRDSHGVPLARAEDNFDADWDTACSMASVLRLNSPPGLSLETLLQSVLNIVSTTLGRIKRMQEGSKIVDPEDLINVLIPADEALFHYWYGALETFLFYHKACQVAKEYYTRTESSKPQRMSRLKLVDQLEQVVKEAYQTILKMVDGCKANVRKHGMKSMLNQVRFGPTGDALGTLLGAAELDTIASKCVESNVDCLEGILQVKLK